MINTTKLKFRDPRSTFAAAAACAVAAAVEPDARVENSQPLDDSTLRQRVAELELERQALLLEVEKHSKAATAAAASELNQLQETFKAKAQATKAEEHASGLQEALNASLQEALNAFSATDSDTVSELTAARDIARKEAAAASEAAAAASIEASEMRSELEAFGIAAIKSASDSDARIVRLEADLQKERARADAAEAEVARFQHAAALAAEAPAAEEEETEPAAQEEEDAMRRILKLRRTSPNVRRTSTHARSRRSSASSASTSAKTPGAASNHTHDGEALSTPECETPAWLRDANFAQSEDAEDAEKEAASMREALEEKARRAAEAEKEAERKAAEVEARAAAEVEAKERELLAARGEQKDAASSLADLRARVEALEADKAQLASEKSELLLEIAQHAGHLNHKQKIHYLGKLKVENDELKQQLLKQQLMLDARGSAVGLSRTAGGGKENQLGGRKGRA